MRQLKITKQVTNRETASLDKYLQEIGKVDLITADEEVELAQRIKAGDQIALEKLNKKSNLQRSKLNIKLVLKGHGSGRSSILRAIKKTYFNVVEILDITPITHNGCRPPKIRRL